MRPQQQNRRMRGRNNNNNNNSNRKGPNPLTRSYESNGPDVKIRGSAQQIAEKYATLARDAMSSGDRVMAENYLQHAEHYNRIIAAAQAQMPIQNVQNRDDYDEDMDEEGMEFATQPNAQDGNGTAQDAGAGPQPVIDGVPAEVALNSESGQRENNSGGRRENFRNRDRRDRNYQNGHRNGDYQRQDDQPRSAQASQPSDEGEVASDELPAFLKAEIPVVEAQPEAAEARRPRRPRRPRRDDQPSDEGGAPQESAQADGEPATVSDE
ncbi:MULTISPECIES: DUF4167 domain-containing protein [Mesorhizobium]|nr:MULTISPECIES: DUF4167 domain-containing protein [Mesorhizobium]